METKTDTKPAVAVAPIEVTAIATARTIEVDRFLPKALEWTPERVALLKGQVCPPTATQGEFELFLDWCKATGLNPFIQQAYLIERSVNVGGTYVKKHQPQAAIGGFRALADLQPDFEGGHGGAVYAGDKFAVNQQTAEVVHEWDTDSRIAKGMRVIGAWWHVLRRGRVTRVVFLELGSRVQTTKEGKPTKFWATDPAGMITKCAEAAAFREAFPSLFSGVFLAEEVREEYPAPEVSGVVSGSTATDALKDRIAKSAAGSSGHGPSRVKPLGADPVLPLAFVRFGAHKGTRIADLSGVELDAVLEEAKALRPKVRGNASTGEPWLLLFDEGVSAVAAEIAQRRNETAPTPTPAPEPGSEG